MLIIAAALSALLPLTAAAEPEPAVVAGNVAAWVGEDLTEAEVSVEWVSPSFTDSGRAIPSATELEAMLADWAARVQVSYDEGRRSLETLGVESPPGRFGGLLQLASCATFRWELSSSQLGLVDPARDRVGFFVPCIPGFEDHLEDLPAGYARACRERLEAERLQKRAIEPGATSEEGRLQFVETPPW